MQRVSLYLQLLLNINRINIDSQDKIIIVPLHTRQDIIWLR